MVFIPKILLLAITFVASSHALPPWIQPPSRGVGHPPFPQGGPLTGPPDNCRPNQFKVRKEWGNLKPAERKAYTDAVLCLQKKPSKLSHDLYNTTSRYDDFVAVHINLTRTVHNDGIFLPWHRGFVQLYEDALVGECGYRGAQPYWDWVKHAKNLTASPLFDGSAFSLSGQGKALSAEELAKQPPCRVGNFSCPTGTGGGCVTDGPFKDYTIGYLPSDPREMANPNPALPPTAFHYQKRCFSRNLNQFVATNFQTAENLAGVTNASTIAEFQAHLDNASGEGFPGLHPFGHWTLGPTGADIFSSPADPAFWLHHGMVDKVWTEWQAVDPWARVYGENALFGTVTGLNIPPSEDATLGHVVTWGPGTRELPLGALMAVGRGTFCYRYE